MRHCLTDDGPQMDAERTLNDVGEEQAKVMRKFTKLAEVTPDVILCSDFARAVDTAKEMQRSDTKLIQLPALRPDGTVAKAWKAITKAAAAIDKDPDDGAVSVLVVTHSPLIQLLLASVAFCFHDEKWEFHHGAIAYINTHESRFRWYVNPKLAAHLVGEDPKEVENQVGEALVRKAVRFTENLIAQARRATIEPLRNQMRTAVKMRWKKQLRNVKRALQNSTGTDGTTAAAVAATAIPFQDAFFAKQHNRIKRDAFTAGTSHAAAQLGINIEGAVQGIESVRGWIGPYVDFSLGTKTWRGPDGETFTLREADQPTPKIPAPNPDAIDRQGYDLQDALDSTTVDRAHTALTALDPFSTQAALAAVDALFHGFTDPGSDKLSRADTVALQTVSNGYHGGASATAGEMAAAGITTEKRWEVDGNPCEACQANADEGWIPEDAPHTSGDFEPPLHPNCMCSETYRRVKE